MSAAEELDVVMKGPSGGKMAGAFLDSNGDSMESMPSGHPDTPSPVPQLGQPSDTDRNATIMRSETPPQDPVTTEPAPAAPSIVYLTSDSPHTLDRLSPNTSYIIGGLVDKNRHKGICYKRACERGIPTAKLPIGEYMTMQSRSVLAINHVVEIMLKWLETGDWGEAFLSVIPKRKEAKLKANKTEGEDENTNQDAGGKAAQPVFS